MTQEELIRWISSMDDTHKFYKNKLWRKKRKAILERDNNECQMCKKAGRYSPAEVVHHIKHLKSNPALALMDSNLISLCGECHNVVHPEKQKKWKKKVPINKERW